MRKSPASQTKLFIAYHKWREGRTGPHVLPASHRHSGTTEVLDALQAVEYARGFHGDGMHVLLVHQGLLLGIKGQQHGTLVLEVGLE